VTFRDIIEAVEGPITLNVCTDGSSSCALQPTCRMYRGRRQALACAGKIGRLHLERVMTAAERVADDRLARGGVERRPRHLEQRKILSTAIEQDLIAETVDHLKAEDARIEAFRAREVRHLDTEMIQPLEFHRGHRIRLSTRVDD
ncbi:MAG: hypothetical protein WCA22_04420, partial [Candidatus Binatus sp.]